MFYHMMIVWKKKKKKGIILDLNFFIWLKLKNKIKH